VSTPAPSGHRAPTAVVFDIGGVLVDWNPRHLYRRLFEREAEMEWFLAEVCTGEWNTAQDAGRPWREAVASLVDRFPDQRDRILAFRARWMEMVNGPIHGTVVILDTLAAAGVPLYALTNWSADTWTLSRRRLTFADRFRDILVSGMEGLAKPDPAIFRLLLARFRLAAPDCVYIDDSPANVAAAAGLGFRALHFTSPERLARDLAGIGLPAPDAERLYRRDVHR